MQIVLELGGTAMLQPGDSLDLRTLGNRLSSGSLRPGALVEGIAARLDARGKDKVWIHRVPREALMQRAAELERRGPQGLPLYGIPFAIKDNIDLAGHPTTAACPDFAYVPQESSPVVQALLDAGAIAIGKTNLDQFATGLVGTRSPYGACENSFNPKYVSGGSSSGSAVAVAAGLVSFSLGTDTAGSGRVPAAFNNLVGLKPTVGLLSARGVVPACRSLDCISIFALTGSDAAEVLEVAAGFDPGDAYSRRRPQRSDTLPASLAGCRLGVPRADQLEFFGDAGAARVFSEAVDRLEEAWRRAGGDRPRAVPRGGAPAIRRPLGRGALRRHPRFPQGASGVAAPGDAANHLRRRVARPPRTVSPHSTVSRNLSAAPNRHGKRSI